MIKLKTQAARRTQGEGRNFENSLLPFLSGTEGGTRRGEERKGEKRNGIIRLENGLIGRNIKGKEEQKRE